MWVLGVPDCSHAGTQARGLRQKAHLDWLGGGRTTQTRCIIGGCVGQIQVLGPALSAVSQSGLLLRLQGRVRRALSQGGLKIRRPDCGTPDPSDAARPTDSLKHRVDQSLLETPEDRLRAIFAAYVGGAIGAC